MCALLHYKLFSNNHPSHPHQQWRAKARTCQGIYFLHFRWRRVEGGGGAVNEFDDHFVCVTRTKLRFDLWLFLLSSVGLYILLRSPVLLSQFSKKARLWWHDREVSSQRNNFPATDMEPSCCIIALNLIWNCNLRRFSSFSVSCVPAFVSLSLWPRILAKLSSAYSAGSAVQRPSVVALRNYSPPWLVWIVKLKCCRFNNNNKFHCASTLAMLHQQQTFRQLKHFQTAPHHHLLISSSGARKWSHCLEWIKL